LQVQQAQSKEVLYYGFFFDSSTAISIKTITDFYLNLMTSQVLDFKLFLETAAEAANVSEPILFYTKPLDPATQAFDPYYHITAKYCGNGIDCSAYAKQVSDALNQPFEMELVGFVFTNRTYGIRVKLSPEQEKLFDNSRSVESESDHELELNDGTWRERDVLQSQSILRILNQTLPGIKFEPQEMNFNPTNNKPHITIGCSPGVSAVTTGTDLNEVIAFENDRNNTQIGNFTLEHDDVADFVIHYQNSSSDSFVVYPRMKIIAHAKFEPYYLADNSAANSWRNNYYFILNITLMVIATKCVH
jgi:hypothetical protein